MKKISNWFPNWFLVRQLAAIRARPLSFIFALSCALLVAFTFLIYSNFRENERHDQRLLNTYELTRFARRVQSSIIDSETGLRGYFLTGERRFLEPYDNGMQKVVLDYKQLQIIGQAIPEIEPEITLIGQRLADAQIELRRQIRLYQTQGARAVTLVELQQGKLVVDRLREPIEKLMAAQLEKLGNERRIKEDHQTTFFVTLFVGALVTILGLLVANLALSRLQRQFVATEASLRESEEAYRLVMEGINDGVYDYAPRTGQTEFASSYWRQLGYQPGDLPHTLRDAFTQLIHPDDRERVQQSIDAYSRQEADHCAVVFRMLHRDGAWRWMLLRAVGVWNGRGELVRLVGIHTDITEQKNREEALRAINAEIQSFTYIASHDLRAPLVNLKGFAGEIALALSSIKPVMDVMVPTLPVDQQRLINDALGEDIPEGLNFIDAAVERMNLLTSAMLDLSRIGSRQYHIETVSTSVIVTRCLKNLGYELTQKNVTAVTDTLPGVETDPVALEQVFANVMDNAVKYLDDSRPGTIAIRATRLPGATQFSIEDNGRGIPDSDREKVFDIFRRAGNAGKVRGSGMGMAYVKAILRRVGGSIWYSSQVGQGTTFYFTIPDTPPQELRDAAQEAAAALAGTNTIRATA